MKKFITMLILVLSALSVNAKCIANDSWTGPDKNKHALVGAAIGGVSTMILKDPKQAIWVTTGVAAAKELYDATGRGTCSLQDFTVTVLAGAAAAGGTHWIIAPKLGNDKGVFIGYVGQFK